MTRVVLSIGSNLGDRMARLQAAVDGLGDMVRALSPVYETDAWGVRVHDVRASVDALKVVGAWADG